MPDMFWFGFRSRKPTPPQLSAVFVSETGLVRKENQDNVLVALHRGVFCVADGVGGAVDGGSASAILVHELRMMMHAVEENFESRVSAAQLALVSANIEIYKCSRERGAGTMGTTAAVMVFDLADRTRAAVIHVGDSRVYRIRGGMAKALTRDHRAPGGNALTRAIGAGPTVKCDCTEIDVRPGDRFVICSDGVHGMVSDGRIAAFVAKGQLDAAAERLSAEVVKHGAEDNYSFILIEA